MKIIEVLLILTVLAFGETVELDPVEDTYTIPAGGCFGSLNELDIANKSSAGHPDERTMILWDTSEYEDRVVISGTLKINAFFVCPSGEGTYTKIYAVTQSWDESWSGTHASHAADPVVSYHFLGTGWHEVDVTALVSQWLSGGQENFGLVIQVVGVYPYTKFRSRETGSNGPVLEIVLQQQALEAVSWAGVKSCFRDE